MKWLTITASTFNLLIEIDFDFDPIAYRCLKNVSFGNTTI
jgi:hypothetical protein